MHTIVDSWSNVHISYLSKDEASFRGEVKYIKKECGSWEDPEVADGGIYTHVSDSGSYDWPMPHSLAVDDSCNVHISAGTGRSLGYAFKEGVCSICSLSTFRSTFGLID